MIEQIAEVIAIIRRTKPIILCITNYVTMDFMANSLLALGAAPIMTNDARELEELVSISAAVNINIGTLDAEFTEKCRQAAALAQKQQKALVLDPVGAGASQVRTDAARDLMRYANVIKGNNSEIMALLDNDVRTHGVESAEITMAEKQNARVLAKMLARSYGCAVVISGVEDFIIDAVNQTVNQKTLSFGSPLMPLITGMGCTLGAVIATFKSIIPDAFTAAWLAVGYFGMCGNLAHLKVNTPAAFRKAFIDELYSANLVKMRDLVQ